MFISKFMIAVIDDRRSILNRILDILSNVSMLLRKIVYDVNNHYYNVFAYNMQSFFSTVVSRNCRSNISIYSDLVDELLHVLFSFIFTRDVNKNIYYNFSFRFIPDTARMLIDYVQMFFSFCCCFSFL